MNVENLDPATPFPAQLTSSSGPITLINTFIVPEEQIDKFLDVWQEDAAFMKSSPGCISTQMHRGIAGSSVLANVAIWESTEALFAAFRTPEFQAAAARYPEGITAYPHIFEKIAIGGICVA
jgi:quinol monooxygenase YgiN